ncbi:HAD family hydrolase [Kutzneria sp. CA-103260]|uniref:HAD family hydrolase n=1 Tax=Kutzneria sp. CA-103260 TaxID=2802641 RepID=UPI001BAC20C8|nr:HAD family phosphatase [Kutzneria sp. CA-103260]QUQ63092.1 HAD family phosphatase [Kutzneria sp. CA-103260]
MTVKAVWTDFGGVLTPPLSVTFNAFCTKTGLDPAPLMAATMKVTARYGTDDIMLPLDTPLVSEDEWLAQVRAVLREEHGVEADIDNFAAAWFGDRPANQDWLDRLRELRESGLFVGLISNMPPAWDQHWRRMVDPVGLFDEVLLSFEVGFRKPDRRMFDLAVQRTGIAAEHSVFVDDLPKNCDGARAAGWHVIQFTDTESAVERLAALLGPDIEGEAT